MNVAGRAVVAAIVERLDGKIVVGNQFDNAVTLFSRP